MSAGGAESPGPRDHCFGGALTLVPCVVRVAGGESEAGWPRAPLPAACSAGAVRRPRAPGAAPGVSSGGSVPAVVSAHALCATGGLLRSPPPRARACGRPWGEGVRGGEARLWGLMSARLSGPGPLGAGLLFWPSPAIALLPASPPLRRAVLPGGRGSLVFAGAGVSGPGQRSVVSGQRVRGTPLPRACACLALSARANLAESPPAWPPLSRSPGSAVKLVPLMSCCADGGGGGWSGSGLLGLPGGALGPSVRSLPPVIAVWGPRLGLPGIGPLLSGLAVTCASVFLVQGGCPPASITQKRPNHGQVSVHGEPKFIEGQQPYVQ